MTINLANYETGAIYPGDYEADLARLQKRLLRVQVAYSVHRRRSMIVFEGWDASGKGGTIQRLTAGWDPRHYAIWPIVPPRGDEKDRHFLWRFWNKLPGYGQIAIFDRSWYGRVLVERIDGHSTREQWQRAYDEINEFEAQQKDDGTAILKLFLHVTQEEQERRVIARIRHSWKRWKVGADDIRNLAKRSTYLEAMHEMFEQTATRWAPWTIIDANNKKASRIAALSWIADQLEMQVPMSVSEADPDMLELAKAHFGARFFE